MAITASDILIYLTGATVDGGVQASPDASLGNYRSSTLLGSGVDNNLFDDVTGSEAASGDTEYRCYCIKQNHATQTLSDVKIWIEIPVNDADATISFAVETPQTANLTNGNAQTIADESTAPVVNMTNHNGIGSGISNWSTATTKATGVGVNQGAHDANLDPGEIVFVWVRRVYAAGAGIATGVSVSLRIEGDTPA